VSQRRFSRQENFQLAISSQRRAGITRRRMIGSFRRSLATRSLGGIHYAPTAAMRCTLRVHSCAFARASAFVSTGVIFQVIHLSRYALNGISILLDTSAYYVSLSASNRRRMYTFVCSFLFLFFFFFLFFSFSHLDRNGRALMSLRVSEFSLFETHLEHLDS